jgi:hypothetical protein
MTLLQRLAELVDDDTWTDDPKAILTVRDALAGLINVVKAARQVDRMRSQGQVTFNAGLAEKAFDDLDAMLRPFRADLPQHAPNAPLDDEELAHVAMSFGDRISLPDETVRLLAAELLRRRAEGR